ARVAALRDVRDGHQHGGTVPQMLTATVVPLAAWPAPLEAAAAFDGPLAFVDGPLGGPDAWTVATGVACLVPNSPLVVVVDPPRRPPGILALMAATLDGLSRGRLVVALQAGPSTPAVYDVVDRLLRGG